MIKISKIINTVEESLNQVFECRRCKKSVKSDKKIDIPEKLIPYLFFDPKVVCRDCLIIELAEVEKVYNRQHQSDVKRYLNKANIPVNFVKNYDFRLGNKKLIKFVRLNANNNLFIHSKISGTCKTRTVLKVVYDLIDKQKINVRFYLTSQLLRKIMGLYSESIRETDKFIDFVCKIDILILDDFGKEKLTDRAGEVIFEIIDRRIINEKRTWITSNYSGNQIIKRLGERGDYFGRRIKEYYKIFNADKQED